MDSIQLLLIILGAVLGIFLYWVGTHSRQVEDEDDRDLDDWDQQDQLESDEV